jgi:tetratricopeptide (TPR) repeat protein
VAIVAALAVRERFSRPESATPAAVLQRQTQRLERAPRAALEAYQRGLAACEAQDFVAGVMALEAAAAEAPDYALIQHNLGVARAGAGLRRDARAAFERALRLEPALAEAWLRIGLLQVDAQEYPPAEVSLTRALSLDPNLEQARLLLGHVALLRGDLPRAEALAREAVQRQPESFAAVMSLGDVLSRTPEASGQTQALERFREAVELSTDATDPEGLAHRRRGELALRLRHADEAVASLQIAARKAPLNPTSWYLLAQALRASGDSKRAAEASRRAQQVLAWASEVNSLTEQLGQQPGVAQLYFRLGKVEAQRGRTAAAISAYRAGLSRDPSDAAAKRALAALERSAGKTP